MSLIVMWFAALSLAPALAQAPPSTRIGTAALISPSASDAYYGSSTSSTNGLGLSTRPDEIRELTRALRNDVDLIYDYVRNAVETEWSHGLRKGALGALLDRSGTPFDQAKLMVDLVREAGYTASYLAGTITLNGAQFADWTGITSAAAACQLLSSGAIPAAINGSTTANCDYGSASVSTVTLGHIWVSVTIGSTAYLFDPSYKPQTFAAGINLATATQLAAGEALSDATSGMSSGTASGVGYVRDLNADSLNAQLQTYGANLLSYIEANAPAASVEEIVGAGAIVRFETPTGGLRQTSLPYPATTQRTWTGGIPDQCRTTLRAEIFKDFPDAGSGTGVSRQLTIDRTLYVDEIYGRKLVVHPNYPVGDASGFADFVVSLKLTNESGAGPTIASYTRTGDNAQMREGSVRLTVRHPYAAAADGSSATTGDYMDRTVDKAAVMFVPFTILNAWGDTGRGLQEAWGTRTETPAPEIPNETGCDTCDQYYYSVLGDARREQIAASWMVQSTRAARLHAAIAKARYALHHALGVSAADTTTNGIDLVPGSNSPTYFVVTDSFDRLDVESAFSLTSVTANAADRRAAIHAIAATGEALQASIAGQIADLPDTTATPTRMEWANRPPAAEDPSGGYGPRRFYRYDAANAAQAATLTVAEGQTSTANDGVITTPPVPELGNSEMQTRRTAVANAVSLYANAGFDTVAAEDAFLGPGQRGGAFRKLTVTTSTHSFSQQRGGALIATRYVAGEPVEIAHIAIGHDENAKGGGGGAQSNHQAQYDPSAAADVLKTRFADRSRAVGVDLENGAVTYAAPAQIVIGNGDFPHRLTGQLIWRGGDHSPNPFGPTLPTQPATPWTTNWQNMLSMSASGLEAMGETDARAAAGTIGAFLAMQDLYRATPSAEREITGALIGAWWLRQISGNVVTVNVGADTRQFVRTVAGQWLAPGAAGYATLTQSGTRVPFMDGCTSTQWTPTRGWNYAGMSFQVTGANGDVQSFAHWTNNYYVSAISQCGKARGFRLTGWTFPQGVTLSLVYQSPGAGLLDQLVEVNNSLGRKVRFNYSGDTLVSFDNGAGNTVTLTNNGPSFTPSAATDPANAQTRFTTTVVGGKFRLTQVFDADDGATPSLSYDYDTLGRVKEARDAVALQAPATRGPHLFFLGAHHRGERQDPAGGRYAVLFDGERRAFRHIDEIGRATNIFHDGRGRTTRHVYPEGDEERLAYDARNHVVELRRVAKPGSGLSDLVVTATFDQTWNKPATITDPRGYRTDFAYIASGLGAGELASATRPAPSGAPPIGSGTRPVYSFTYGPFGRVATTTDPTGLVVSNAYNTTNGNLNATTLDPSGVNATTSFTYDALGDPTLTVDPRGNATSTTYDAVRRPTVVRHHNGGSGAALIAAERTNYNSLGQVTSTEGGTAFSGTAVTAWQTRETRTYTQTGQVATVANGLGQTTTNAWDPLDRLLQTTDPVSRAVRFEYDLAGQRVREIRGFGSTLQQDYARYTYSANGQRRSVRDANDNRSAFVYDGFDRLCRLYFPVTTLGANAANTGGIAESALTCASGGTSPDYEGYGYDAGGNRTSLRLRSGETIAFAYDALGRETLKDLPGGTAADVHSGYDLAGRRLFARFASAGGSGVDTGYDSAGRLTGETSFGRALSFQYDVASSRTRITWPDGVYVQQSYDAMNRLDQLGENGSFSGAALIGDYAYDALARRSGLARGTGPASAWGYDLASRLTSLAHDLAGTADDQTYGFAYTAASQISQRTAANDTYNWTGATFTRAYARNGLNQYTTVSGTSFTHDARGNLTSDGSRTFGYDLENRLLSVGGSASLALAYDPLGRLRSTTAGGTTTEFLYDGDRLVAEYVGGTLQRRYVHGAGIDEPLATYVGATLTDRRHLIADHQGTIVAEAGASVTRLAYGPYGEPSTWTGPRFRYTGQAALPEAQLYHYKARAYDPVLGRFLQTDPVGYEDELNLYAYVANDPLNEADPSGKCPMCIGAGVGAVLDYGLQVGGNLAAGQSLGEAATNVDLASIGASAALGAVGGFAGARALTAGVQALSPVTKGRIGDALARIGIAARGERVIAADRAANKVPELGTLSRQAGRGRPDYVVRDGRGTVRAVEAKFGDSPLKPAQKALQSELGESGYRVARTSAEQVGAVGSVPGGAAAGVAANCATGAQGPCK